MLKVSYIISVYKNIPALELILLALEKQSFRDFEVIVAEDNDAVEMQYFLKEYQKESFFVIKHISQKDTAFLKTRALNKALAITESDYVIFTDGDCIPHRHFIREHYRNKEKNKKLFGRRVMLSKNLTQRLYNTKNLKNLNLFSLLLSKSKRIEDGFYLPFMNTNSKSIQTGIWGCNWSIHKIDLLEVNGFDEDYNMPGFGEDTDIEWRLLKKGVSLKKIKNIAIQYHLYHSLNYIDTSKMEEMMKKKLLDGFIYCKNGLDKYLPSN